MAVPVPLPSLLHAFRYSAHELEEWRPESLAEVRSRVAAGHVVWVNVNGLRDPEVVRTLEREFGIHPLTLEDILHTHQRPKVEAYPEYLYVVSRMVKETAEGELETEQVSILLGEGWVVTLQEGKPGDVFEPVRLRLRSGRPTIRKSGPDYLLYALMDSIVDAYFPIIELIGERAEELEDVILEGRERDIRARLQMIRRDLLTLRRVAWPQRDALGPLERGEHRWIKAHTRTFLRDVTDHISRVIDFVETNRELVSNLMDLHLANVGQRTNEVMKVLTIVATIFIPLTFIAGVYGMNFQHMPELESPYGYPAVLLFMATLGIGMYLWFHRRGWA